MANERFYELEREFRKLGEKIDKTLNAKELSVLQARQAAIVAESRQIMEKLTAPEKLN